MVTRITTPHSIRRALNYNEQKVRKGQADFLYAANYLKESQQLNFYDKLQRFTDLISLNESAKPIHCTSRSILIIRTGCPKKK